MRKKLDGILSRIRFRRFVAYCHESFDEASAFELVILQLFVFERTRQKALGKLYTSRAAYSYHGKRRTSVGRGKRRYYVAFVYIVHNLCTFALFVYTLFFQFFLSANPTLFFIISRAVFTRYTLFHNFCMVFPQIRLPAYKLNNNTYCAFFALITQHCV